MSGAPAYPSNSAVKRAGKVVRKVISGASQDWDPVAFNAAIVTIAQHRKAYESPLNTATNGLRSMVRTLGLDGEVSQRLKRMPTIVDKLRREPTLALDRMQDIGGCRVVLPSRDDVYRLQARLVGRRPPLNVNDYIVEPRTTGYRGVHVIVTYGPTSRPRPIEVQLRTRSMHRWAMVVEDLSGGSGVNLKGDGDDPMHQFLECYARVLECVDLMVDPSQALIDEYGRLYARTFRG